MAKKQHPQRGSPSYVQWQKQLVDKENLNAQEAAAYLNISMQTLYKLTSNKAFPFSKPGGKMIIVKKYEIDEWIAKSQRNNVINTQSKLNKYLLK